ncbi:MAG: inorganic phosphate transporter [Clostridia bacterium]|nr:inorganic phosphate transporter [Clostridia bacterium]
MIYLVFILSVMLNGATDAANAITGAVCGGAMSYRRAAILSALLNFLGLTVFSFFSPSLYESVGKLSTGDVREGAAVLLTVVIFAGGAWFFSIPTSESHAMIAAMAGAGAAFGKSIDKDMLIYITVGAVAGALLGALLSGACVKLLPLKILSGKWLVTAGCAVSSFVHGAQDGQKFLALAVATGIMNESAFSVLAVATLMLLGTLLGGKRIVIKLGERMTPVDTKSAVASDMGSAASLLFLTLLGIPASTTHTKTCAIAGAAAASGKKVDIKELLSIVLGWLITLPVCFLLAYFITKTIN